MQDYHKLTVWTKSLDLVKDIYQITTAFPKTESYGLSNQIQRAAVSIPSNIAEGSSRSSKNDIFFEKKVRKNLQDKKNVVPLQRNREEN